MKAGRHAQLTSQMDPWPLGRLKYQCGFREAESGGATGVWGPMRQACGSVDGCPAAVLADRGLQP